jgi:hypothetical protein
VSQWPYDLLEIGEDADERTIKRAYARLLKLHRPEDDPAGFQRVNNAYQFCLSRVDAGATDVPQGFGSGVDTPDTQVPEPAPVIVPPFDIASFIAALFDVSQTASGRDILGWLQAHPVFYSIGARDRFAPEIVDALLREPALPPRQAAVLHFLGLDAPGPARRRLEPSVSALERHAQMTLEDAQAIRKPYMETPPSPSSSGGLGWAFGGTTWFALLTMTALARCSGGSA